MEEEIKWQFAPEFYKYVVGQMQKASDNKQVEDFDNAFVCYTDIYSSLLPIIERKDEKTYHKLKEQKLACEEAQDNMYLWATKPDTPNKHLKMAEYSRKFRRSLDSFHELIMKGAYISGILVPVQKDYGDSGINKFRNKYVKPEVLQQNGYMDS